MTARYERLKRLALEARALPVERRDAWLDAACVGDPALRAEVSALLAADATPDPRVRTGAMSEHAAGLAASLGLEAAMPERIGPYRVLELIGQGGMGAVHRAEQDEPLRREVAIKFVRPGPDTAALMRRLEAERATLARMDHPFIARVFDTGFAPEVGPYVVMELVRGEPITAYCDRHRLTVRQRLELFLQVCEAVQHAHRRGVIHRDLKPSNVLVSHHEGRPLPKVIDFGIARAVAGEAPGDDGGSVPAPPAASGFSIVAGTPDYMSPEQAGLVPGGADTRSDVYSLGVMLHELMVGRRPVPAAPGEPGADIARPSAAADDEAVAAARGTSAGRLRRAIAGDLDAILLQALRHQPGRRTPSVERLADDVRRHLAGLPVRARPGTWSYRAGSLVRRHPATVAGAVALALGLAVIAVISTVQSARLARERDRAVAAEARARAEADLARHVADFLLTLFEGANPAESRGAAVTARELLDRGARRVERELATQPAMQARMLRALGEVYQTLGLYPEARALHEKALERLGPSPGPDDAERAAHYADLGTLDHDEGDLEASERRHRDALALRRRVHGDFHEDVARSLNDLAVTLQAAGDLEQAEPLYREALAMNERRFGARHEEVAWGQTTLGWVVHQQARYAEAESLYRRSLASQIALLGEPHPDIGSTLNNLAGVRYHLGDYAAAEAFWRRAWQGYQTLYPGGHPALARAMFNLARVLQARGHVTEADSFYRASLVVSDALVGVRHPAHATHLVGLAGSTLARGDPRSAERMLREALALRRTGSPASVPVASAEEALAAVLLALGRPEEAGSLARHALEVRLARQGGDHPDVAIALIALGRARGASGDAAGADSSLAAAHVLRRRVLGPEHPLTGEAAARLGLWRLRAGRTPEALALLASADRCLPERLALRSEVQEAMAE